MADDQLPTPQPPQNLPTQQSTFGNTREPEDILAAVDDTAEGTVEKPSVFKPIQTTQTAAPSIPPAMAPVAKAQSTEPILGKGKKTIVLLVVLVLVLGVLAAAGWYGYQVFFSGEQSATPTTQDSSGQQPAGDSAVNQPSADPDVPAEVVTQPQDTDRDGLTDEDETLYGTDPQQVDTDADGLTDRDEVRVFSTDPNNTDTDGDTYIDGQEVRGGYDPKGPGRLLEIQ